MPDNNSESIETSGIEILVSGDNSTACISGPIDIDSSPAVRSRLLALLDDTHQQIISVDLAAVTHIDSSGVATLIEALKVARAHQSELRLQGLHDRLLRLFEFTGVLSLFNGSTR